MPELYDLGPGPKRPMIKFYEGGWADIIDGDGRKYVHMRPEEVRELLAILQRRYVLDSLADV